MRSAGGLEFLLDLPQATALAEGDGLGASLVGSNLVIDVRRVTAGDHSPAVPTDPDVPN